MKASSAIDLVPPSVVAGYGSERLVIVHEFESFRNWNWLVEDERRRRYVLRRTGPRSDPRRIEFQARFQLHLLHHGFPTPEIIETREGDLFVTDSDGSFWTLLAYIDGDEYDFSRIDQAVEAARRLADFHRIAEAFSGEWVTPLYQEPVRDRWARASENQAELGQMYAGEGVEDELAYLRERWRELLAEWPLTRIEALPVGWLHGDYHGRNVVFAGDEICALFDFDEVERGPMVYDIALAAQRFGREGRGSLTIRPEVARHFIQEYARRRALTDEERAALPMMMTICFAPSPRNYRYCEEQRGEDIVARLRDDVANVRALQAEMELIGPLLQHA